MNEIKAENAEYIVEPCDGGRWITCVDPGDDGLPICSACKKLMVSHTLFTSVRRVEWTTRVPAKKGWYWYRPNEKSQENFYAKAYAPSVTRKIGESTVVRVDEDHIRKRFIVRFPGTQHSVEALAGEWAGPLQRPWRGSRVGGAKGSAAVGDTRMARDVRAGDTSGGSDIDGA